MATFGNLDVMGIKGIEYRLYKLAKEWGIDVRFICMDQARLWLIELAKKTAGNPEISPGDQKKMQFKAVENDLNELFAPESSFGGMRGTNKGDRVIYLKGAGNPTIFLSPDDDWREGSTSAVRMWHQDNRKARYKRVTKRPSTRHVGNKTYLNKKVLKTQQYSKLVKSVREKVGFCKAGWMPSIQAAAAATHGSTGNLPKWITKHAPFVPGGGFKDQMSTDGDGYIKAQNKVYYAHQQVSRSLIEKTGNTRKEDLEGQVHKRRDRLVNQWNEFQGGV